MVVRPPRRSVRPRQSALSLLITLLLVIAAMVYLSRESREPQPGSVPTISTGRAGPPDIYPNAALTPGAIDPEITQTNIDRTICNPHWSTRSERPPEEYTYQLKRSQIREYNDSDPNARDYEEDHLIPLELGGSPTNARNLWPEAYHASIPDGGAKNKDLVENYLHDQVCSRAMPLARAQHEIATDWYRVYVSSLR